MKDEIFEGADELVAPTGMESLQEEEEQEEEDQELDPDRLLEDELENRRLRDEFPVSAEPELVAIIPDTAEESIPLPSEAPETPHLASTVCDVCLELNLTHPAHIIKCERCEQAFCYHYASAVDAQYCVNCMSDISVTKQTITRIEHEYKDKTGETHVYRRKAREIKIEGLSWQFAQRKIADLSDVELDLSIEYHNNLKNLLISEQERRRNAKMHRYAGVKVNFPTPATTNVSSTTTTTVKKTRTISKNKADEQLAVLMAQISKAKGIDPNLLAALLKTGGK